MFELQASPSARGGRIDLTLVEHRPSGNVSRVVLVRRRGALATHPADGLVLFDTAELLDASAPPWERREERKFVLTNSLCEGGLVELELRLDFEAGSGSDAPSHARVRFHHEGAGIEQTVAGVAAVELEPARLRLLDSAGAELAALSWTPAVVTWEFPAGVPARAELSYHLLLLDRLTAKSRSVAGTREHELEWTRDGGRGSLLELNVEDRTDPDSGVRARRFQLRDRVPPRPGAGVELEPGQIYYYQGFVERDGRLEPVPELGRSALATGRHGFACDPDRADAEQHRLYELLPAVLRRLDEPDPSDRLAGPLRNFVEAFACAFDELRSHAEALRLRHDVLEVRSDLLPELARYIGWDLDRTQSGIGQRLDVQFAPELYRSIGTPSNLEALITRATGLEVRIKEFVRNVAFTNAPEALRLWELWQRSSPMSGGVESAVTTTDGFHGRPAPVFDALDRLWVFGHAREHSGWRLFAAQVDPEPGAVQPISGEASELDPALAPAAAPGELWLFSSVERSDSGRDLQARRIRIESAQVVVLARPDDPAESVYRLTDHPAEDRFPAATRVGSDLWLFWQSSRSGRPAIWFRRLEGDDPLGWNAPAERLTDGLQPDETPAVLADPASGAVHVVWSREHGDHASLWWQTNEAGSWRPPERLTRPRLTRRYRDRSPALVRAGSDLRVYWHSDRPHPLHAGAPRRSRIWGMTFHAGAWSEPELVVDGASADEEPGAIVAPDGSERLLFRSQRRGKKLHWTRTLDMRDSGLLSELGTFDDRAHYTYDTGRTERDWYAGNAVGLFFSSVSASSAEVAERVERMRAFVEPFRPEHVRLIFLIPLADSTAEGGVLAADRLGERVLRWLHTVDTDPELRFTDHLTVDTRTDPIDPRFRIVDSDVERMSRS